MRVLLIVLMLGVLTVSACRDSLGPDSPTITFRADQISCAAGADVEITIDGESQGSYHFAAGSEWVFQVSAGVHNVKAQGEEPQGGFVNLEREVTVSESGDFTIVLTCDD